MAALKVGIEVKPESDVERGRFTITVEFPAALTFLSDVFAGQGVFDPLEKRFHGAIRAVVAEYSKLGAEFVSRAKQVSRVEEEQNDLVES